MTSQDDQITWGENRVHKLLSQLPSEDYYPVLQPVLNDETSAKRPDFIIVCWHLGIAVVEVKDWTNIKEGSGQDEVNFTRKSDGKFITERNPEATARGYATKLANLLQEHPELICKKGTREKLCIPWKEIVIFPHLSQKFISYLERERIFSKGVVLGKEALTSAKKFEHVLKNLKWHFRIKQPLIEPQQAIIRRVVKPRLAVGDYGTLSPLQEILSEEAVNVAENASVRLVRGVAGSGKSLVLVRRARYLHENHPNLKILVMNYNKNLTTDLRGRIGNTAIEVDNFHKFCARIVRGANRKWKTHSPLQGWLERYHKDYIEEGGMEVRFVTEEIGWRKDINLNDNEKYLTIKRKGRGTSLSGEKRRIINDIFDIYREYQQKAKADGRPFYDWHDAPLQALDALKKEKHKLREFYDVIMLDEAQDFAPTWIAVVKKLLNRRGELFICDDPTQSLFRYFSWKQKGIPVQGRTRILRVPFRSTKEINIAAHELIRTDPLMSNSPDITLPKLDSLELYSGDIPLLVTCSDLDSEIAFIQMEIDKLYKSGISGNEIAILCHDRKYISYWGQVGLADINILHFDVMKGLEFRVVFLPHLNTAFTSLKGENDDENFVSKRRRKIFTAMTRARQVLIMSHHETFPKELKSIEPYIYHEYI